LHEIDLALISAQLVLYAIVDIVTNSSGIPHCPTLQAFKTHARLYGTELVYETADQLALPPHELGSLAAYLSKIDR
jgi:hypothetical protein